MTSARSRVAKAAPENPHLRLVGTDAVERRGQVAEPVSDEPVACALAYAAAGWPVFPVHCMVMKKGERVCSCRAGAACPVKDRAKHPHTRHGCKDATTDAAKIRAWWKKWPTANIGIATGSVSDLVVVDIDPRNGGDDTFDALVREFGAAPETPEVLTGGGGRHLYFRDTGGVIPSTLGPGIDIKADGGYVVAPPSVHIRGRRYAWELSALPSNIALADFPRAWSAGGSGGRVQGIGVGGGGPSVSPVLPCTPLCIDPVVLPARQTPPEVTQLIDRTLPPAPGQRRAWLGKFARGLKFDLGFQDAPLAALRPWVRAWYALAWPKTSQTTGWDDNWDDFVSWWRDVRIPLDTGPAPTAFAEVEAQRPWPMLADRWDDVRYRHLIAGCRRLQQLVGDSPFALSCHQAGRLTGVGHKVAYDRMCAQSRSGVLTLIKKGTAGSPGRRDSASRWRFNFESVPELGEGTGGHS